MIENTFGKICLLEKKLKEMKDETHFALDNVKGGRQYV